MWVKQLRMTHSPWICRKSWPLVCYPVHSLTFTFTSSLLSSTPLCFLPKRLLWTCTVHSQYHNSYIYLYIYWPQRIVYINVWYGYMLYIIHIQHKSHIYHVYVWNVIIWRFKGALKGDKWRVRMGIGRRGVVFLFFHALGHWSWKATGLGVCASHPSLFHRFLCHFFIWIWNKPSISYYNSVGWTIMIEQARTRIHAWISGKGCIP